MTIDENIRDEKLQDDKQQKYQLCYLEKLKYEVITGE